MANLTLKQKYELRKQINESLSLQEEKKQGEDDTLIDQISAGKEVYASAEKLLKAIAEIENNAPESAKAALSPSLKAAEKIALNMIASPTSYAPKPAVSKEKKKTTLVLKTDPKAEKKESEDKDKILKT